VLANIVLQAHFRLSLSEAAQQLGVCASTLKRVCRRKGIPAWPQRKLVKLSRAVDQVRVVGSALEGCIVYTSRTVCR